MSNERYYIMYLSKYLIYTFILYRYKNIRFSFTNTINRHNLGHHNITKVVEIVRNTIIENTICLIYSARRRSSIEFR